MENTTLTHFPALPASRLQRLINRSSAEWTVDDLVQVFLESGLRQVSLMHVGGDSTLKVLDFVPQDVDHLRRILRAGERADGSSLFPRSGISAGASDIILRPRPETAFIDPFAKHGSLVLLCGHAQRDGAALRQSGDTILRNAFQRLKIETGIELHALGEVEYFLGTEPVERDSQGAGDRGYHATSPDVFGEELRREALSMLAEIGLPVKYGHSEVGFAPSELETDLVWEQHEIELALQPLPQAAESVLLTQWVLRNLARRMGMRLSFEPVVRKGHAGSGMHFHLAAYRENQLCQVIENDALHETAQWIIGGLLKYGGALMAFGNRKPGSFLRLFQGKEAPTGVTWGRFNRKALVRLPISATDTDGKPISPDTIEFRLPDGSAFPHMLLAGIAQATCAGKQIPELGALLDRTDASREVVKDATPIPCDFADVAEALNETRSIFEDGGIFPEKLVDREIEWLRAEKA